MGAPAVVEHRWEYCEEDAEKLSKALNRMEVGLPQPYRDQLKMVLRRVNLGWMRFTSDNVRFA
jgi:hypothetical protein